MVIRELQLVQYWQRKEEEREKEENRKEKEEDRKYLSVLGKLTGGSERDWLCQGYCVSLCTSCARIVEKLLLVGLLVGDWQRNGLDSTNCDT